MGLFRCERTFFHVARDVFVFTGEIVEPPVGPGMWAKLPLEVEGTSRAPISSIEWVEVANGPPLLALVFEYEHLAMIQEWDFTKVEGKLIEIERLDA